MKTAAADRVCSETGLKLVAADGEIASRVAKDRFGALAAHNNKVVGPRAPNLPEGATGDPRGRFDTLGTTIYLADSRKCAFAEVLSGFRKDRAAIAQASEDIGWTVDEYISSVEEQAQANGVDVPWAISVDWQMARSIYEIQLPRKGWWVLIDDATTLNALQHLAPTAQGVTEQLQMLTAGSIMGESRDLTTLLAQAIRAQTLDDGSEPLGISYPSKTLHGRSWAYWDRRLDQDLSPGRDDLIQLSSENVGPDPDFHWVAEHYGLPILSAYD